MMKKTILFLFVMIFLIGSLFAEGNQPTSQYNKIFLNPFYRASMTSGTNYTYTLNINPPDKLSSVSSAIIQIDTYLTPTVNYNLWVNGKACNNPTFTVSTTYAGASQGTLYFDCSNVITQAGTYTITLRADKNSGSSTAWIDLTYTNSPKGEMTIHGTEYTYGQTGKVWLQLINSNGTAINSGVCYSDIYTPSGGYLVEGATMTNMNHDGIYYYDLTIPVAQGVYPAIAKCYYTATQDKRVAQSYVLHSGALDGAAPGTVSDTWTQNAVYLKLKQTGTVGSRINATFNFSDYYTNCGNVSQDLMTGVTIFWRGEWNTGTANHDIFLYVFNYTSNSWVTLANKLPGGNGGTDFEVSNSFATNNITTLLGVTSTKPLLVRTLNNVNTEKDKKFWTDYLYASCDQLTSLTWQEVKGSSELHVTSANKYSYTDDNTLYSINNTQVTTLANGSVITNTYYTGIFKHNFQIASGVSSQETVSIEWQGLHSLPCNAVISLFYVNDTGYYPYPFHTQDQTTEGHCSINFNLDLEAGGIYYFEAHARNVWESDLRSTNTGLGSIYPLLDGGCTLWQIVKGYPPYIVPKNQTNENKDYYYRACANMYDDFYWFNKTYQQSLIDKALISDRPTYLQYEADYSSTKFAEDKLNTVTNYLLNNLQSVNDYSQLLMANPLGDAVVNTTDQRYWAEKSTLYQAWKIVNDSCGTGICKVNNTFVASDIWNYGNRTLTSIDVNNTAIADAVWSSNRTVSSSLLSQFTTSFWNYTGTISPILLSQITVATTNAIWNYSSTISSNILTQISNSVWNSPNRNLTYYELSNQTDLTDYNKIQEMVWNATNRNLTYYEVTTINYNTIAQNVWNATDRNLTYYPTQTDLTNYSLIAETVWNFMNRNLTFTQDVTDYNKIQIVVWNATDRNLTYYELSNLSAGDIWNYASRNLTYTPDMTNYDAIWTGVWNYTTRNLTWYEVNNITAQNIWEYTNRSLTEFNFVVNALVNVTEIVDAVWTYNNRSLTFYEVNNISAEDIWSYVNRTLTDYNQTAQNDLTDYSKIQMMVWNATDRNLTYYPAQIDMTNYTLMAETNWAYNNRTLTYYQVTQVNATEIAVEVWQNNNRTLTYYEVNNITAEDIWSYTDRQLTDFNFTVNAQVNETAIANAIWNYGGIIGTNILIQFTNSFWNSTSAISSSILTQISDSIWTRQDRNLTFYNNTEQVDMTNYTLIQDMINNQTDLTNYTLIQEMVWQNLNRSLTEFNFDIVNETEISNAVWQNVERTLTSFNFTVNATIGINNTAIADAVWSAVNRTLSDYNQSSQLDLTNYDKIQEMVWNNTIRELTNFNFTVNTTVTQTDLTNYTLIQQMVWSATQRTLTEFNFTVDVNQTLISDAVWSAINRSLSDYNQSDLTNYDKIQTMVWNNTVRTLTEFNITVNATVDSQAIAGAVWNYTNKTVDFATTGSTDNVSIVENIKDIGQVYLGGTEYIDGDAGKVVIRLVRGTGALAEIELGATCIISLTYPNQTYFVNNAPMTELGDGVYYYDFTVPALVGVYTYYSNCNISDRNYYGLETFHVYQTNYSGIPKQVWEYGGDRNLTYYPSIDTVNYTLIQQTVWENLNRSLTEFNFDVVNETEISDAVWQNVQRTLTEFNFTVDVNQTMISDAIWSAVNRSLTDYNQTDLTDYNKIQTMVWNSTTRELTLYPTSNLTASQIWNYQDGRNLTYYPTVDVTNLTVTINNSAVAEAVWSYNGTINPNIIIQFANDIECQLSKWFNLEEGWGVNIPNC